MNTATLTADSIGATHEHGGGDTPILSVKNLSVKFQDNIAVDDISFDVSAGEVLAIVGESGSGKSVTSLAIMRLVELSSSGKVTDGQMRFSRANGDTVDLRTAAERTMRTIRGNDISMIFQEPLTSLNPVYSVGNQLAEVLRVHKGMSRREAKTGVIEIMEKVRIPEPKRRARQYPHQMSGGMRQRVVIAMALACQPRILIADEPTTALDVTIQAQILALLRELKDDLDAGIIFITTIWVSWPRSPTGSWSCGSHMRSRPTACRTSSTILSIHIRRSF